MHKITSSAILQHIYMTRAGPIIPYLIKLASPSYTCHKMVMIVLLILIFYATSNTGASSYGDGDGVLLQGNYKEKCPYLEEIVRHTVASAVYRDPGIAASLLRLHFHDCFVMVLKHNVL